MTADLEIEAGERFGFGANWTRFLSALNEQRVLDAESSLRDMLGVESLANLKFLDIGSGSGLFSLAARRLGARVHSFDFDPRSVACTQELRRRYFPESSDWLVEQGSVLDKGYLEQLGTFDVVYSWGVLHHTGSMWAAIDNAVERVAAEGGMLFIAIYNDQGWKSRVWWHIKRLYNRFPQAVRPPFAASVSLLTRLGVILKYTLMLKPLVGLAPLLRDKRDRGMSAKYDELDWIGGFPFEYASFESLEAYFSARGFTMINAKRTQGWGCNELAMRRSTCAE